MWMEEIGTGIEELVFYIFVAVCGVNCILVLANIIMSCFTDIKVPGLSLDFYICLGSLPLMVTILVRGINLDWANDVPRDVKIACEMFPALLCFGLLWVTGTLLVKASVIHNFYSSKDSREPVNYEYKGNLLMIFFMLIDAALAIVWVILHPIEAKSIDGAVWTCTGEHYDTWRIAISAYHAFLLVLAGIVVWPALASARGVGKTASNLLSVMIYNLIFVAIAAALMYYLYTEETTVTGNYAINGGLMLYGIFFTLLLTLITKILVARRNSDGYSEGSRKRNSSSKKDKKPKKKSKRDSGLYENDNLADNHRPMSGQDNNGGTFEY